jgi:RNA polymerase sigma-70 factor (ECF subfamily)
MIKPAADKQRSQYDSTDDVLIRLLRAHPPEGAAALYDHYGRAVFSLALRIVGDRQIAEEITQDTFVRCWRSAERYNPQRGGLLVWLLGIAHNAAVDELRSRRGQSRRRETGLDALPEGIKHATIDTEQHAVMSAVRDALRELPAAQREAIELIYFGGLTRQEVAEQLKSPLGTIHSRIRLGMTQLRVQLAHLFDEENERVLHG